MKTFILFLLSILLFVQGWEYPGISITAGIIISLFAYVVNKPAGLYVEALLILLFTLSYQGMTNFYGFNNQTHFITSMIIWPACVFFPSLFIRDISVLNNGKLIKFMIILLSGYFVFYFGSYYVTPLWTIVTKREFINVWTGKTFNSPYLGVLIDFSFLLLCFIPYFWKNRKWIVAISLALIVIVGLQVASIAGTRMPVLIFILVILIKLIIYRKPAHIKNYLFILIILCLAGYFYYTNYFQPTLAVQRYQEMGMQSDRVSYYSYFDRLFSDGLWGGKVVTKTTPFTYFHNIFLDVMDLAGIISVLLLFLLYLRFTYSCIWVFFNSGDLLYKDLAASTWIIIFISYNSEPIPYFGSSVFILFFISIGLIRQIQLKLKEG